MVKPHHGCSMSKFEQDLWPIKGIHNVKLEHILLLPKYVVKGRHPGNYEPF